MNELSFVSESMNSEPTHETVEHEEIDTEPGIVYCEHAHRLYHRTVTTKPEFTSNLQINT